MQIKLLLVTFYLNGELHTVYIGKPSERMSNFRMVRFLKTESELSFSFLHIPALYVSTKSSIVHLYIYAVVHVSCVVTRQDERESELRDENLKLHTKYSEVIK